MRIFLLGYPGDMGGANTECWHTVKLWRDNGVEVSLIPTWGQDKKWEGRLSGIGCQTIHVKQNDLHTVPGLKGSIIVGMCNSRVLEVWNVLRQLECRRVWVNCMTFLFEQEKRQFAAHRPPEAMVYQSAFQQSQIDPWMRTIGFKSERGYLIRGAFNAEEFPYAPRPHAPNEDYFVGRVARPDADKWSSNLWRIYGLIDYPQRKARVMGVNERTLSKIGQPPAWAEAIPPMKIPVQEYYASLHCLLTVNGGARENWPRIGLEAMAAGVPVVAQAQWGWKEMVMHGETGFLASSDQDLAFYATLLARDEELRLKIAKQAHTRLVDILANPARIWEGWKQLFESLS